jgi:CheY-like chemotaxis protein
MTMRRESCESIGDFPYWIAEIVGDLAGAMSAIEEQQKTVLVVEDSSDDLLFIQRAVERAECDLSFRYVRDGEEAIAYLQGKAPYGERDAHPFPALVLLDLGMPKVDGFEVLEWIRSTRLCEDLEVFVVTGRYDPAQIERAKRAGADRVIAKPAKADELRTVVELLEAVLGAGAKAKAVR